MFGFVMIFNFFSLILFIFMYLKLLNSLTIDEIQKYNGKSVKPVDLVNLILNENNIIVVFKTKSIRAADDIKLRSFLKKYRILLKRFKKKDITFCKRFVSYPKQKSQYFFDFLKFMEGFGIILIFDNLSHFFFFENFLFSKVLKFKFFPILMKNNNQYLFFNSNLLNKTIFLINSSKVNLQQINTFFFFQLIAVRNFMYMFIYFKFQAFLYSKF